MNSQNNDQPFPVSNDINPSPAPSQKSGITYSSQTINNPSQKKFQSKWFLFLYPVFYGILPIILPTALFSLGGLLASPFFLINTNPTVVTRLLWAFFIIIFQIISQIIIFIFYFILAKKTIKDKGKAPLVVFFIVLIISGPISFSMFYISCKISALMPCKISDFNSLKGIFTLFQVYILILLSTVSVYIVSFFSKKGQIFIGYLFLIILLTLLSLQVTGNPVSTYNEIIKKSNEAQNEMQNIISQNQKEIASIFVYLQPDNPEFSSVKIRLDQKEIFEKYLQEKNCSKSAGEIEIYWKCSNYSYTIFIKKYTPDNIINLHDGYERCQIPENEWINKKMAWNVKYTSLNQNGGSDDNVLFIDVNTGEIFCKLTFHQNHP